MDPPLPSLRRDRLRIGNAKSREAKTNPPTPSLPPSSLVPRTMADKTARQAADERADKFTEDRKGHKDGDFLQKVTK